MTGAKQSAMIGIASERQRKGVETRSKTLVRATHLLVTVFGRAHWGRVTELPDAQMLPTTTGYIQKGRNRQGPNLLKHLRNHIRGVRQCKMLGMQLHCPTMCSQTIACPTSALTDIMNIHLTARSEINNTSKPTQGGW
jgi:hypothetical protein